MIPVTPEVSRRTLSGWCLDQTTLQPIKDQSGNALKGALQYLRLKVKNKGCTFAQNVSLCVTEVTYSVAGTGMKKFEEEVFPLYLANSVQATPVFNLAAGAHCFVDLVNAERADQNGSVELRFSFGVAAHRLQALKPGPGKYKVKVFASAENATSISREFGWVFGSTVESLQVET